MGRQLSLCFGRNCPGCGWDLPRGRALCARCWQLVPSDMAAGAAAAREDELMALARFQAGGAGPRGDHLAAVYDRAAERSRDAIKRAVEEAGRLNRRAVAS